jgi:hypothetical protein
VVGWDFLGQISGWPCERTIYNIVCTWCCYPLWIADADTDYPNKTSLVSIYFHIPHTCEISKPRERVTHSHFIRRLGFISNFERRGFCWNSGSVLWVSNGMPGTTNGSVFFLPFYAAIVSLTHQPGYACFIPSRRMDHCSPGIFGYGSTMRGFNPFH